MNWRSGNEEPENKEIVLAVVSDSQCNKKWIKLLRYIKKNETQTNDPVLSDAAKLELSNDKFIEKGFWEMKSCSNRIVSPFKGSVLMWTEVPNIPQE